jgi:glycyl-tRNA synthetase beta chain
MAELLLELFSEEIPARMQARAAEDLKRLATERLAAAGLAFHHAAAFVTPRRLTLAVTGLPRHTADLMEEKKGPRVGAPEQAIQGFLRGAGLSSLEQCEKRTVGKAEFWFAVTKKKGVETAAVLPDLLTGAIEALPWSKSMRFADATFRWVRPLQSVLALFDGRVLQGALKRGGSLAPLPFEDGTRGHRFLSPAPFKVADFNDYRRKLKAAHVILDREERKAIIDRELRRLAAEHRLTLKEDRGLLEEVAGLVEWPVVLVGRVDPGHIGLPPEVLSTAMRQHQKYFTLSQPGADVDASAHSRTLPAGSAAGMGKVTHFAVVANVPAHDAGQAIVAGNERVLRARLSDAQFFWDQDLKVKLADRLPALKDVVFHARLGSVYQKSERIAVLADRIYQAAFKNDSDLARQAGRICKADLVSGVVGEFPELQGVIGRYYALNERLPADIANAIAEHYSPQGPNDRCPIAPVSVAIAIADKLYNLVGFFGIDEKPTGSKDPFALRRAALGLIRLIRENNLRINLGEEIGWARHFFFSVGGLELPKKLPELKSELLDFIADRLKVALKEKGVRHDLISAVFALGGQDDIVDLLARVDALASFLKTEDGANLLIAYRRAANILSIEEKRDNRQYRGNPELPNLAAPEEQELWASLRESRSHVEISLGNGDYRAAMTALATLRRPVDAFFDKVTVNTDDPKLRENRLKLLSRIQATMDQVAVFAKIEG